MEEEDYEEEYLKEQALIRAEEKARMEAEWLEAEESNRQLPAKIEILVPIFEINNNNN